MASTRIYRTMGSPTNDKIFTISGWFKLCKSSGHLLFASDANNNTSWTQITFNSDRLYISAYNTAWLTTNRVFRDRNAWYHIVLAFDSTQSTASNRIKLYINGVQETSFATDNRGSTSQNQSWGWNKNGVVNNIGGENASGYGDFLLSHFHNIDGTAYDASAFGSTDATTGEWKINTAPSVTYGNNGFFWLKDSVATTDNSPNSNTFTIGGTLTKTEDCPSNVFNTLDPLSPQTYTFSNGNNTIYRAGSTSQSTAISTLAPSSGKWYWEVKLNSGQTNYPRIGIYEMNSDNHTYTTHLGNASNGTGKWWGSGGSGSGNNIIADGNASTTAFYSFTNGDILMFAMDNDNGKLWFGKNGTWYTNDNSSTTTGTAIGNNTATPAFSTVTAGKNWTPAVFGNAGGETWQCNFGNGYFGTTQITSEGTNASGVGKFEYDVPPNFTAISTEGLNL